MMLKGLSAVLLLSFAVSSAGASFKEMANCQDCVAAGFGWCPKARICGGFQNNNCAGGETDTRRSPEEQAAWEEARQKSRDASKAAAAAAAESEQGDAVLTLTADSFEAATKEHTAMLVEFYAPWCGHCKNLAPEYEKAAEMLKSKGSTNVMAKFDATTSKTLARDHGVRGYPTMIPFVNGIAQEKYSGERTPEAMADYVAAMGTDVAAAPAAVTTEPKAAKKASKSGASKGVLDLDDDTLADAIANHEFLMVEFYAPWCGHCKSLAPQYEKAASLLEASSSKARLAKVDATVATESRAEYDVTGFPTMKVFKGGKVHEEKYAEKRTAKFIANYMHRLAGEEEPVEEEQDMSGLVLEMTWARAGDFMKHEIKNQILVCADFSQDQEDLMDGMHEAAEILNGQFLFAYLDSTDPENSKIVSRVGGSLDDCPMLRMASLADGFKVFQPKSRHKSKYTMDKKGLMRFAGAWSAGQLKRYLRSEPIPAPVHNAKVINIVGHTFDPMVVDAEEDVLLFIYMGGCQYCKAFSEVYGQVAEEMSSDSLTFVKMNGPRNDIDHPGIGKRGSYPNVLLFPADDKENPIKFEDTHGEDVADALIEFISIYGSGN